jgi:hypothetical protein
MKRRQSSRTPMKRSQPECFARIDIVMHPYLWSHSFLLVFPTSCHYYAAFAFPSFFGDLSIFHVQMSFRKLMPAISAFRSDLQCPRVCVKSKDCNHSTQRRCWFRALTNLLRVCGTVLQQGDVHKEFLSPLKEQGDVTEPTGQVILGSTIDDPIFSIGTNKKNYK